MSAIKYRAAIEETRALVRIVKIKSITPIKKADFVELAHIDGWQCVVKKGEFKTGDTALYAEIDALLPISNPTWAFLSERKEGQKTFDGILYSRIRTVKLRGEISQGLLVPVPTEFTNEKVGTNLTNRMDVRKLDEVILNTDGLDDRLNRNGPSNWWERLVRKVAGKPAPSLLKPFPSQLSKSEQARLQNIGNDFAAAQAADEVFEETIKVDGQSMTVYSIPDMDEAGPYRRYGVCSRNYEVSLVDITFTWVQAMRRFLASNLFALSGGFNSLYRTPKYFFSEVKAGNITLLAALKELFIKRYFWFSKFTKVLRATSDPCVNYVFSHNVLDALSKYNEVNDDCITIQGELFGPNIQRNYEGVTKQRYVVYQVYRNGKLWVPPEEARKIVTAMGLEYVHVVNVETKLPESIKATLDRAKGSGVYAEYNPETGEVPIVKREGLVFKSTTRDFSFKVIASDYLLAKEAQMLDEEG